LFSVVLIFIILLFYFIFIVFGDVVSGNDVDSVINASDHIRVLNYYPSLVAFLETSVIYENENRSVFSLVEEYSLEMDDRDLKEFLEVTSERVFSELGYCTYYSNPSVKSPVKVVFKVFIKDDLAHKSSEEGDLYGFISELGYPSVKQKISDGKSIYLASKYEVVRESDCDVII